MGNSFEEFSSMPKVSAYVSDKKSAIMLSFENLRKWREEQRQKFISMQYVENEKFAKASDEDLRNKEEKVVSDKGNIHQVESSQISLESNITADSSATSHMIRCFNDTSQSSSVLSNCDHISDQIKQPDKLAKKPFLRKRSGLLRYMPKSSRQRVSPGNNIHLKQQEKVSEENFITNTNKFPFISTAKKRVDFKEPELEDNSEIVAINEMSHQFVDEKDKIEDSNPTETLRNTKDLNSNADIKELYQKKDFDSSSKLSNPGNESIELAQFEQLEQYAQNSSFNSDSSIVRNVIQGKSLNPPSSCEEINSCPVTLHKQILSQGISLKEAQSSKLNLSGYLQEAKKKKKHSGEFYNTINSKICDNDALIRETYSRMNKFQEEISKPQNEIFLSNKNFMNERCSTPVENPFLEETNYDCGIKTAMNEFNAHDSQQNIFHVPALSSDEVTSLESKNKNQYDEKNTLLDDVAIQNINENDIETERGPLKEKIAELEKEIENYQALRARLVEICKEREDILKKLKREYDGIDRYKEEQKIKFENEIENERRQLKRERETFNRFKKLQKENFSGKERKELTTLRQENEKLKEELKQQKNKFSKDIQRMKNQLANAEKEADTSKLKAITLEEQVDELLNVLKTRNFKTKKSCLMTSKTKKSKDDKVITSKSNVCNEDININKNQDSKDRLQSVKSIDLVESEKEIPNTRPKVRFNLIPKFHDSVEDITSQETESFDSDVLETEISKKIPSNAHEYSKDESITFSALSLPMNHPKNIGKKIEKILESGDKEILFSNGNRKIISADEKIVTVFFYNGDVKNIYPDRREVYKYENGVVEECLPSGLKITTFPNGQTERRFPNGFEEIRYPDGTVHKFFTDGSEVMIGTNGMKDTITADGTRILESENGQREIKTASYTKREFPDGSVKIIYANGRKESRHSNGRIRIKDKDGREIFDTKHIRNRL